MEEPQSPVENHPEPVVEEGNNSEVVKDDSNEGEKLDTNAEEAFPEEETKSNKKEEMEKAENVNADLEVAEEKGEVIPSIQDLQADEDLKVDNDNAVKNVESSETIEKEGEDVTAKSEDGSTGIAQLESDETNSGEVAAKAASDPVQDPVPNEGGVSSESNAPQSEKLLELPEAILPVSETAANDSDALTATGHLSSEILVRSGTEELTKGGREIEENQRTATPTEEAGRDEIHITASTASQEEKAREKTNDVADGGGDPSPTSKEPSEKENGVSKPQAPAPPPALASSPSSPTSAKRVASAVRTVPPSATSVRKSPSPRAGSWKKGSSAAVSPSQLSSNRAAAPYHEVQEEKLAGEAFYDLSQPDESAALSGQMLPAIFRRGGDNSHINRMLQGSYSRYISSCGMLSPNAFIGSFYRELPVPGLLPFRGEQSAEIDTRIPQQLPPWRASSACRQRNNRPGRYPGDTLSTAVAGALHGARQREAAMLAENNHNELRAQRIRRRRDPQHCVDPTFTDQYYYQQKSKASYVPRDQNPNALMLQYNHLYDFGDGSRFKSHGAPVRNPTALPPKTYEEQKAGTVIPPHPPMDRAPARLYEGLSDATQKTSSSSLRTAKAVDSQKLHPSQFRQAHSIEDVIASDPTFVMRSAAGVRSAVASGKMDWSELPNRLQGVMSAEHHRNDPSQSVQKRHASEGEENALPSVQQQQGGQYEVSRVNFTKRYEPHATPSAFVR